MLPSENMDSQIPNHWKRWPLSSSFRWLICLKDAIITKTSKLISQKVCKCCEVCHVEPWSHQQELASVYSE